MCLDVASLVESMLSGSRAIMVFVEGGQGALNLQVTPFFFRHVVV